jgi:mycothiol synthase
MTTSHPDTSRLPGPGAWPAGRVVRVPSDRRLEALARLVAHGPYPDEPRARRFLEFSQANQLPLDALWARTDADGRFIQSVLAVANPGRTAMFFASRPASPSDVPGLGELIGHAADEVALAGTHLAQALLAPEEHLEFEAFAAGGFHELAKLSYLERTLPRRRERREPPLPAGVTIEPYCDAVLAELVVALEASYEDTLDCPGLRGLRDTCDIVAGHRATGAFEPDLWRLLRIDGEIAGALLLNPSPHHNSVELVYLGLARTARGRGLGRVLLRHGLRLLGGRNERTINLAVDERNSPAIRLYRSEGFVTALRRVALIRALRRASP